MNLLEAIAFAKKNGTTKIRRKIWETWRWHDFDNSKVLLHDQPYLFTSWEEVMATDWVAIKLTEIEE